MELFLNLLQELSQDPKNDTITLLKSKDGLEIQVVEIDGTESCHTKRDEDCEICKLLVTPLKD